jgi:RNA polymerase sigma-70 factor (ECF subfamily)
MPSVPSERDTRFAAWLAEHRGISLKIARAYAANPQDQADLHQELLLQVWLSAATFRGQSKPSTWIYRVCLNTALTWRRDEKQYRSRLVAQETLPELPAGEARPGATHEDAELVAQLYAAIRGMEAVDRSLLLLALDGLSYGEMAEITGLTENHVGVALNRARTRLAARLKGVRDELE